VTPQPVLPISFFVVGVFALGMALSFYAADPNSPTSRALAAMLGLLGIAMLLNVLLEGAFVQNPGRIWTGIFSLLEAAIVIAAEEWILGIARTEADADARSSASPRLLRVGQALAAFYGLAGVVLPGTRRQVWQGVLIDQPVFYLFAVPFFISIAFALAATVHVFRSRIDPSEKVRLNAMGVATPFSWRRRFCRNSGSPPRSRSAKRSFWPARFATTYSKGSGPSSSRASSRRNSSVSCGSADWLARCSRIAWNSRLLHVICGASPRSPRPLRPKT
jgi:hypothetical protein